MEEYNNIGQDAKLINDEVKPLDVREVLDRLTNSANKLKIQIEKKRNLEAIISYICCPCLTCCKCLDWCTVKFFGDKDDS
jgi:hypothetical protein